MSIYYMVMHKTRKPSSKSHYKKTYSNQLLIFVMNMTYQYCTISVSIKSQSIQRMIGTLKQHFFNGIEEVASHKYRANYICTTTSISTHLSFYAYYKECMYACYGVHPQSARTERSTIHQNVLLTFPETRNNTENQFTKRRHNF